jgi:hypothetical protein
MDAVARFSLRREAVMVKILPAAGKNSPGLTGRALGGIGFLMYLIAMKNKSCVLGKFADDRKSTNPQVRRF